MDDKKKEKKKEKKEQKEKPVTVHITNNNTFQKGVGAFVTNLNHLTIVMDSEGNMKLDAQQLPVMPHTEVEVEQNPEDEENDDDSGSNVVNKCFIFTSDFVKEKVEAIVKKYYKGSHADLALIEITLFDHGQLRKRNSHKAFARSLAVWGIMKIASDEDLKSIVDCIKDKYSRIPKDGYKEWGEIYLNEKNTCINIGHEIEDTMPYIRKKEE